MIIYVLTLFPKELGNFFLKGIFKKAIEKGLFDFKVIDIREFATDKHHKVDDTPLGLSQGMLLKAEVVFNAIKSIDQYEHYRIIYPCPKGKIYTQNIANQLVLEKGIIFICGYYEGIDERLFQLVNIERISIGNYVLSSGELPALTIAESIVRLIPDVVNKTNSIQEDSLINGLLEYPQYTYPRNYLGYHVPDIILSGHHKNIKTWQKKESFKITLFKRPELLTAYQIDKDEKKMIEEIFKED